MKFDLIAAIILGIVGVPFRIPGVSPISPIIPRERAVVEQVIDRGLSKLNQLVGGTVFGHHLDFIRRKMCFVRGIAVEFMKFFNYPVELLSIELFSTEVVNTWID